MQFDHDSLGIPGKPLKTHRVSQGVLENPYCQSWKSVQTSWELSSRIQRAAFRENRKSKQKCFGPYERLQKRTENVLKLPVWKKLLRASYRERSQSSPKKQVSAPSQTSFAKALHKCFGPYERSTQRTPKNTPKHTKNCKQTSLARALPTRQTKY